MECVFVALAAGGCGEGLGTSGSGDSGDPDPTGRGTLGTTSTNAETGTTDEIGTSTSATSTASDDGADSTGGTCGDGVVDPGEVCDDGVNDGAYGGCERDCLALAAFCGDGQLDRPDGEACDQGQDNGAPMGVCMADCTFDDTLVLDGGGQHTCAVRLADGTVRCWGLNHEGQLGDGGSESVGDDEVPSAVGPVAVGGVVRDISSGFANTCALLDDGDIRCWGTQWLGDPVGPPVGRTPNPTDDANVDLGGVAVALSTNGFHSCAVLDTGSVRCWGASLGGALGYGNLTDVDAPAAAGDLPVAGTVVGVASGLLHTCALLDVGTVRCWGGVSTAAQLPVMPELLGYGDGTTTADAGAVPDVPIGGVVVEIVAGALFTCARLDDGAVRCWGHTPMGDFDGGVAIGDDETPADVGDIDLGGPAIALAAGPIHVCAILQDGGVRCWGRGDHGALGHGHVQDVGDDETPASLGDVPIDGLAVAISAGNSFTCAQLDSGPVQCWGRNDFGQLGYGHTDDIGDDELANAGGLVSLF